MVSLVWIFLCAAAVCISLTIRVKAADVDYLPGTLNVILSSPHGGSIRPSSIPNRDYGCYSNGRCIWSHTCGTKDKNRCKATTTTDSKTRELTLELRAELFRLTGHSPHTIINNLKRVKLDANRERDLATFNVTRAALAWDKYHGYLTRAKTSVETGNGTGILFDIHGHGQAQQWAMLGYLVYGYKLQNGDFSAKDTSIRALIEREVRKGTQNLEGILQGFGSFGSYLKGQGFASVPSPTYRSPGTARYFSGGYITQRYGSKSGGSVDVIQIESPSSFRFTVRKSYVKALARAINMFICRYY